MPDNNPAALTEEEIMDMSSEDLSKLTLTQLQKAETVPEESATQTEEAIPVTTTQNPTEVKEDDTPEESEEQSGNEVADEESDVGTDSEKQEAEKTTEQDSGLKDEEAQISPEDALRYKQFHDTLTAQFKANGTTFQISDPNEVLRLMQKGLHYTQKMQFLAPWMNVIKVLEERGLNTPESLGQVMDLHDKKPEAIAKLIQDSGIDSFELDAEKAKTYVPTQVDMSMQASEVASIEQDYGQDPDFGIVLNSISQWDGTSKQMIQQNPVIIRQLMEQKKAGYFDQIMQQVLQDHHLGRIQGSILQHYDAVGRQLYSAQKQTASVAQPSQNSAVQQPGVAVTPPVVNNQSDARKKAAAASRTSRTPAESGSKKFTADDLLDMDLDDFSKLDLKSLISK